MNKNEKKETFLAVLITLLVIAFLVCIIMVNVTIGLIILFLSCALIFIVALKKGENNASSKMVVKEEEKEPEEPLLSEVEINDILKELKKRTNTTSYKINTFESDNLSIFCPTPIGYPVFGSEEPSKYTVT